MQNMQNMQNMQKIKNMQNMQNVQNMQNMQNMQNISRTCLAQEFGLVCTLCVCVWGGGLVGKSYLAGAKIKKTLFMKELLYALSSIAAP